MLEEGCSGGENSTVKSRRRKRSRIVKVRQEGISSDETLA
jgi:hypothetical protein